MSQVAERIIKFIEEKNIPDADLLEKAAISRQTLWRYRVKKHEPSLETVSRLIQNFPIRAYWLLTGKGEMEWGTASSEVKFLLEKILKDEDIKKTLYYFLKWQSQK